MVFHQGVHRVLLVTGITIVVILLGNSPTSASENKAQSMSLRSNQQVAATGPLHVSSLNPRYFTDESGKAIYLTGSHTWANLQDAGSSEPPPGFDYEAYLNFLQANHHNFFRLWAWEQSKWAPWAAEEIWFSPSLYQRSGPQNALDGALQFDVNQFDQNYFDRMRRRIILAGERGIYVSVMLFNGFSIDDKGTGLGNAWQGHPFNPHNNINGIDGDFNGNGKGEEIHTLQISSITRLQEAYVRKVIDTVNDLDNVLYEISNESPSDSQDWQYHMIRYIKDYEAKLPKQHPVGMTVEYPGGENTELFSSPADWISPNSYFDPPASDGRKVILADTDHIWGIGGDRQWVWKSFTRGLNPIFMDCYDVIYCDDRDPNDPTWLSLRLNMGYTRLYANRMNLAAMTPRDDLCSSAYCLANPAEHGAEFLVYLPEGGSVIVNLTATSEELSVEWFNPATGVAIDGGTVRGGGAQFFNVPFSGDAVLYLYDPDISSSTPAATYTPEFISTTVTLMSPTNLPISTTQPSPVEPSSCFQGTGLLLLSGLLLIRVPAKMLLGNKKIMQSK